MADIRLQFSSSKIFLINQYPNSLVNQSTKMDIYIIAFYIINEQIVCCIRSFHVSPSIAKGFPTVSVLQSASMETS